MAMLAPIPNLTSLLAREFCKTFLERSIHREASFLAKRLGLSMHHGEKLTK
jgi:hypothetical protein